MSARSDRDPGISPFTCIQSLKFEKVMSARRACLRATGAFFDIISHWF